MATALSGLFSNYIDPQQQRLEQQQAFAKQLGQTTDPRAFIAAVGSNMGNTLGNFIPGMMGVKSTNEKIKEILDSVKDIEDPVEQAITAAKKFSAAGMSKEAQLMYQHVKEAKSEQADLELKQARIKSAKALEEGKTAMERQTTELSDYEQRLANGETLKPKELARARVLLEQVRKDKTYVDRDTQQLVTIKGFNAEQAVPNLLRAAVGGPGAPAAVSSTTVEATPGSRVKQAEQVASASGLEATLNNIEKDLETLNKTGTIPNEKQGALERAGAMWKQGTEAGKAYTTITSPEAATAREKLAASRMSLLNDISAVTGLSGSQLNSDTELKRRLEALGTSTQPYEAQKDITRYIRERYLKPAQEKAKVMGGEKPAGGGDYESMINRVIEHNKGKRPVSRDEAIRFLKANNKIPADYK